MLAEGTSRLAWLAIGLILLMGLWCLRGRMPGAGLKGALYARPHGGEAAMASWARTEAPADALLVIPPSWQMFRPLARRSVFITWRDGDAILWQRSFVSVWHERLAALGIDLDAMPMAHDNHYVAFSRMNTIIDARYEQLTDGDLAGLRARYQADFAVVAADHPTELPVVCAASGFKVLDLSACAP